MLSSEFLSFYSMVTETVIDTSQLGVKTPCTEVMKVMPMLYYINCPSGHNRYVRLRADQCGAVAFEMPFVILFLMLVFIIPIAGFAVFGFRYISAFQALRDAGQYMQYHPPSDVTTGSYTLPTAVATIGGYSITGIGGTATVQLYCGGLTAANACSSGNVGSPKYYTFQTNYVLVPFSLMKPVLCGSSNPTCTFTLTYTERFQ